MSRECAGVSPLSDVQGTPHAKAAKYHIISYVLVLNGMRLGKWAGCAPQGGAIGSLEWQVTHLHGRCDLHTLWRTVRSPVQRYPPLFRYIHPDRGNYIGFVFNFSSLGMRKRVVVTIQAASDYPVENVASCSFVQGVSWSDHHSFWCAS